MKIKSLSKEEIDTMSYDDLAYVILREKGKKMKTADIFKTICDALELTEKDYEERIADFFTLLATEKRFIQLPKGYWDLKENHSVDLKITDNITDEEDDDIELELEEVQNEEKPDVDFYEEDADEDSIDDGLKDLVVMDDIDEEGE